MSSLKFSVIFVFLLSLASSLFTFTSAAAPTYLYHICSEKNFTINSTYRSNFNRLLFSLPSYTNRSKIFYRTTEGDDPNKAYGLFQCRGDVTSSTCQDCVAFASTDVTQRCPAKKGATIWYDECYLRFSDSNIFYDADLKETYKKGILMSNTINVTIEPRRFHELVLKMMNKAADQAAEAPNRFETIKGNSTTSQSMYGLLQCTQDLYIDDCRKCLSNAIANMPTGTMGGIVLLASCTCRYELYLFYNENLTALPPAAPALFPPAAPALFPPATPTLSPPTPVSKPKEKKQISSSTIIAIVAPITVAAVLFVAVYCFLTRRAGKKNITTEDEIDGNDILTAETLQFDLGTIQAATNRFSTDNKLGAGGFGVVYKGVLPNGKEIAVKRLSKRSGQGAEEFKNEVVVVAKLQHRNLVRLQGFCLEGEEKILVYEFVPNKSLDYFLYDLEKQRQLEWHTRYKIIGGIARGILYLHEDSRLRIIHRDLKASNVLLDGDMNPKIADFGMARIFGVDQIEGNTNRIVGTYRYMAPEYVMQGQFSMKSDVYSFGVLVLEIITGKKNSSFYRADSVENLLSYAWELWRDETPMQLLDSNLTDSYSRDEVLRSIHIGLLCIQEDPATTVVRMLNSYSVSPPLPQQPAFFIGNKTELDMHISDKSTKSKPLSVDAASITELCPR